jgi:tetratricopeptide (TPR) repeat protein
VDAAFSSAGWTSMAPMDRPYGTAITVFALLGRHDKARQLSEEWERDIPAVFKPAFQNSIEFARGELALATGDGARALEHFKRADAGSCVPCTWSETSRAFDAMGNTDSALVWMERYLDAGTSRLSATDALYLGTTYRRAGELLEDKGDVVNALRRYEQFIELWKDADPLLQPQVTLIRERIARMRARRG